MARTFFAYHIEHEFGTFRLNTYHSNSPKATEGDTIYVVSGYKKNNQNSVFYKLEGIFKIQRRYIGNFELPKTKNRGIGKFEYKFEFSALRVPPNPIELENLEDYDVKEIHNYFSSGQNFNPLPTQPDYKKKFDLLLAEFSNNDDINLINDLEAISLSSISETEKERLSKARVGQGKFRKEVIRAWGLGEKCALTGIDVPELLIASHIKPWRLSDDKERLDAANGILLATHIDKLFDNYLVSFSEVNDRLILQINPTVKPALIKLGAIKDSKLNDSNLGLTQTQKMREYLREHFAQFQKRLTNSKQAS